MTPHFRTGALPRRLAPLWLQALADLTRRYRIVLSAAWRERQVLAGPGYNADEAAFLPAALSVQATPPHPAPRWAAGALCALAVVALTWAFLGEIDIVAVAPGRVVVSEHSKLVQPLEASIVRSILVQDGDRVHRGQLLIELDATAPMADGRRLLQERSASLSEQWRASSLIQALSNGQPLRLPPLGQLSDSGSAEADRQAAQSQLDIDWSEIAAKLAKLDAETAHRQAEIASAEQLITKLETTLPLARQREQDFQALTAQGFMSSHAGQDRSRERIEMEQDLAGARAHRAEAIAALRESAQSRIAYRAEVLHSLRERQAAAELKVAQLTEEAAKTRQRGELTHLLAPVDGTVQQLAVHTPGGVVTPAQPLMVIVPGDAEVSAEVVVENKDIGFVRPGQAVEIKLDTFPFTRYGTVPATVVQVSADAVNDDKRGAIFPAVLHLQTNHIDIDGRTIVIAPGMSLSAEIKTGRRRVIDYLLSPLRSATQEAGRER